MKRMTVAELLAELQKLPHGLPVVIGDADTDWDLHLEMIELLHDRVRLSGDYGNRMPDENH